MNISTAAERLDRITDMIARDNQIANAGIARRLGLKAIETGWR
jgi:hypothetical protein